MLDKNPRSGSYQVRINGQVTGPHDRKAIEERSAGWWKLSFPVEVADAGADNYVGLREFLDSKEEETARLTPDQIPHSGSYQVRLNGQVTGPLDRNAIKRRSAEWFKLKFPVEVADAGADNYVGLREFLDSKEEETARLTPDQIPHSGSYQVRLNGQVTGPLDRNAIERRSAEWFKLKFPVEVADAGKDNCVALEHFLRNPERRPLPPWRYVAVAASIAVGLLVYWLYPRPVIDSRPYLALGQGNKLMEERRFSEAATAYSEVTTVFPQFAYAFVSLGNALVGEEHYDDAIQAYTRAIDIDPSDAGPYFARGWTRWFVGDLEQSALDCEQAIVLEPHNITYYLELEKVLYERSRPDEVAAMWSRAIEHNPSWDIAYIYRMNALQRAEDWGALRTEVPTLLERTGENGDKVFREFPLLYYQLGRALDESGSYGEAIQELHQGLDTLNSLVEESKQKAIDAKAKVENARSSTLDRSLSLRKYQFAEQTYRGNLISQLNALQEWGDELLYSYLWSRDREGAEAWNREKQLAWNSAHVACSSTDAELSSIRKRIDSEEASGQ